MHGNVKGIISGNVLLDKHKGEPNYGLKRKNKKVF